MISVKHFYSIHTTLLIKDMKALVLIFVWFGLVRFWSSGFFFGDIFFFGGGGGRGVALLVCMLFVFVCLFTCYFACLLKYQES